ncbi:MAG: hypothetical protein QNI84_16600 [Henriciella sp.]|nr:hypothetical protein [Henriciella sp.]
MADGTPHLNNRPDPKRAAPVPLRAVSDGFRTLIRQAFALLGLVLIAIAIPIAFVTPLLPIGLPIAIFGVALLGRNSVWGRRWMEGVLDRHPRVERFAPNWLMKAVFGRDKNHH